MTEIEELELIGGKRYRYIYACLERANLSELDVPALIQEIESLSRAFYLYPYQSTRNHFSKSMPYQLLNHLFILYLSLAGTMVTLYSLQIIPDDEEFKEENDQLVEDRSKGRRRAKRKTMAELTPEGQAARRAAQTAKKVGRDCARLRGKLQRRSWKQLNLNSFAARSEGASLPAPKNSWVFPKDSEAARDAKPESQKGRPKRLTGVKILFPRTNRMVCTRSVLRKGKFQT